MKINEINKSHKKSLATYVFLLYNFTCQLICLRSSAG